MKLSDVQHRADNSQSQYYSIGQSITVIYTKGKYVCLACVMNECKHTKLVAEFADAEAFLGAPHVAT